MSTTYQSFLIALTSSPLDQRAVTESLLSLTKEIKQGAPWIIPVKKLERNGIFKGTVKFNEVLMHFKNGIVIANSSNIRAGIYRAVRYLVRDSSGIEELLNDCFHFYIIRGLERDQHELWERMQSLKLVKRIMELTPYLLSNGILRSLVAVASDKEDNFWRICFETLREFSLKNPRAVAQVNGIKCIFSAVLDPSTLDLVQPLITTITCMLEDENTRQFIRPGVELYTILSGFTDIDYPSELQQKQRWQATKMAITGLMRSWSGIIILSSDARLLSTLVSLLCINDSFDDINVQEAILDTFDEILLPVVNLNFKESPKNVGTQIGKFEANLLKSYGALLCASLFNIGLLDALTQLIFNSRNELQRKKANSLFFKVFKLGSMFLSKNQCEIFLGMHHFTRIALGAYRKEKNVDSEILETYEARRQTAYADQLMQDIEVLMTDSQHCWLGMRKLSSCDIGDLALRNHTGYWENSLEFLDEADESLRLLKRQLRLSLEPIPDRLMLESEMSNSKILATKDYTKWDWEIIERILQDILVHPQRLMEALKSKWVKRLCGYFRFLDHTEGDSGSLYSKEWRGVESSRTINCCMKLFDLLLKHDEGILFVTNDSRGKLIQETIKELDLTCSCYSTNCTDKSNRIPKVFTLYSCQICMSSMYIGVLMGVAARSVLGRKLLVKFGFYDVLKKIGCIQELEFLSRLVISHTDPSSVYKEERDVYSVWLAKGSTVIRSYILSLAKSILSLESKHSQDIDTFSDMNDCEEQKENEHWCIDLLLKSSSLKFNSKKDTDAFKNLNVSGDTSPNQISLNMKSDNPLEEKLCGKDNVKDASEDIVEQTALTILSEVMEEERYLRSVIQARPIVDSRFCSSPLLFQFLNITEGVKYIDEFTGDAWFARLSRWNSVENLKYGLMATSLLSSFLLGFNSNYTGNPIETDASAVTPVDSEGSLKTPTSKNNERDFNCVPLKSVSIPINMFPPLCESKVNNDKILMRLPWNIEILLSRNSAFSGLKLKVDTYVVPNWGSNCESGTQIGFSEIRVSGVVVDDFGVPARQLVENHLTIHAQLNIGACTVRKDGNIEVKDKVQENQEHGQKNSASKTGIWAPWSNPISSDHPSKEDKTGQSNEFETNSPETAYWTSCRPYHRQQLMTATKRDNSEFSSSSNQDYRIFIPEEACVFKFEKNSKIRTLNSSIRDKGEEGVNVAYLKSGTIHKAFKALI